MQLHKQSRSIQPGDRVLTDTGRLAWVLQSLVNMPDYWVIEFVVDGGHQFWKKNAVTAIVEDSNNASL